MIPPRRFLVATDFSAGAERAADTAIDLAATWGAQIEWIHVGPESRHALTPSSDALMTSYIEHAHHEAQDRLEALANRSRDRNVECAVHLATGRPDQAVARCAEETESDWVVVGTHGRSGIQSLLIGSVAEKIVRSSPVTVLCVHSGAPLDPGGILIYGEDFGPPENRRAAVAAARALDAHIIAVHAIEPAAPILADTSFCPPPALVDSSVRETRKRLEELFRECDEDAEVEVCLGSAAVALCDQAQRRGAALIVTGATSRKGLERWILGSVVEKTLRRAPCSVLILR